MTKRASSTRMARYEQNPLLLGQECICYVTFYKGTSPIDHLRTRVEQIIRLNPVLSGRIKREVCGLYVETPDPALPIKIDDHFRVQDSMVSNTTRPIGKAIPVFIPNNGECIRKKCPLFVVAVLCNRELDQFCLVISISHMIADGVTFYQLFSMLGTSTEPFALTFNLNKDDTNGMDSSAQKFLPNLRKTMFRQLLPTFDHPFQFAISLIRARSLGAHVFKKTDVMWRWNHYEVPAAWIEYQKQVAMKNAPPPSESGRPQFVSTNDVLVSWFFARSNVDNAAIYLNIRNKVPFLKNTNAGNYMRPLMFQRGEFESPWLIRESISGDVLGSAASKTKFVAPGFEAKFGVVSNVCGLFQKVELPGCEFIEHHYTLHDDLFGAGVPYCTVYTTAPGKVCIVTNFKLDENEFVV
ncbi:hypothetical protein HK100_003525 [Physocladia obscura]|uniref:Uncharacterized protein n=1 Tax=Physocladia obscura TaxID=109957 RepID=A0AAD5SU89_9FUNG|nr:hypothetical protein HK100_003525 [Physocladia obscura]